ncbi:MAG TPA: serine/threonine-protein kinase, partial [Methylomirabilota bacterium]|nr:serine/threonine-protein kinase [Methylomirabilota bacterium]
VYLGEHIYLKKLAAIKIFYAPITDEDTADFLKEARTIASLDHPHIIQITDCGVERHIPYLVMKYAPGGTLRQRHPKGSHLSSKTIVKYVNQIADALQYAHDQKYIHRDIKPENMLVASDDFLYVSDFGIALIAQTTQTTQDIIGTWAYMAPEQFAGKPLRVSDQYSLGVTVYEWICGERPFQGTSPEILSQHLHFSPPSLKEKVIELPVSVEQVVFKALNKDPKNRYESIQAFADALAVAYGTPHNNSKLLVVETIPIQPNLSQLIPPQSALNPEVSLPRRNLDIAQKSRIAPQSISLLPPSSNPLPALEQKVSFSSNNLDITPSINNAPQAEPSSLKNGDSDSSILSVVESNELSSGRDEALTVKFAIGKLNDYLLWFLMVLEVTLLIEFLLMLIGAAQNNLFAGFMYALTVIPLYAFNGIVPSTKIGYSGASIEWTTLIAIGVYFIVFWALRMFLNKLVSG